MNAQAYNLEDFLKPAKKIQLVRQIKCDCVGGEKAHHEAADNLWACRNCGDTKIRSAK